MKSFFLFILIVSLFIPGVNAYAYAESAGAACLMNAVTGEVVFEKNSNKIMTMASTTKIMTLIVALENSKMNEKVKISHNAASQEGSSAYIEENSVMTMKDLLYGLMLNSGNDAAVAVAEHISGSTEAFAEKMNETAKKIGVENTSFKNPNGLDEEGHYTTAKDLAKITCYALKNKKFTEIVSTKSYTASLIRQSGDVYKIDYENHNRLLREYEGCIGVKTGYTEKSGRCLVSAAQRDGAKYVAVTLNCSNDWAEHKEMLDYGFSRTRYITALKAGECIKHIVSGSNETELIAKEGMSIPVEGYDKRDVTLDVKLSDEISAPLNAGEKVGVIGVYCGDEFVGNVDIVAKNDLYFDQGYKIKPCFFSALARLIRNVIK